MDSLQTQKYQQKQYQEILLFDGFIRGSMMEYHNGIFFRHITSEISGIIFNYFNVYIYEQFGIIQRWIDLFTHNLHRYNVSSNEISCIAQLLLYKNTSPSTAIYVLKNEYGV